METLELEQIERWEHDKPSDGHFTSDDVLNAYLTGKKDGLESEKRLQLDKLRQNLQKTGNVTGSLLTYFSELNFNPIDTYLRVNNWNDFNLLILLPESEFLSKEMLGAYNHISDIEEGQCDEFFHLNVSVCDVDGKPNLKMIKSDNYLFRFTKK